MRVFFVCVILGVLILGDSVSAQTISATATSVNTKPVAPAAQQPAITNQSEKSLLKSAPVVPKISRSQQQDVIQQEKINREAADMPYLPTSVKNLANAFFAIGVLDINKKEDIDDYLIITNCDLYQEYYSNEFEWQKIHDSARKYLKENKNKFSRRFEFVAPILLDKYDPQKKHFDIALPYRRVNSREVKMSDNSQGGRVCGGSISISGFPFNVILRNAIPFSMTVVPLQPERAIAYIHQMERRYGRLSGDSLSERSQRPAYVRFRATFQSFFDFKQKNIKGSTVVIVTGKLDSIEIFSEPELSNLLYKKEFGLRSISEDEIIKQITGESDAAIDKVAPE